ncbi:15576_t:CDS:2, partial [Gigaspora rosea]
GQMATDQDAVSLVLFNHSATVIFENRSLLHSEDLLEEMMKYFAEGSTDWIKCASDLIKKYHNPLKQADNPYGLDSLPENELRDFFVKKGENGNWVKYRHSMASVRFDHQNKVVVLPLNLKIDKISLEIARDQAESYEKVLKKAIEQYNLENGYLLEAWKHFLKTTAMLIYKKSAELRYHKAQLRYGYGLYHGQEVSKNKGSAMYYFKSVALNKNYMAMYNLGIILILGESNDVRNGGEKWLIRAAKNGH